MVKPSLNLLFLSLLLVLGACASKSKDQMRAFREAYAAGEFSKASEILKESELKKDKKSVLLLNLEEGSLFLAQGNESAAIVSFQTAIELIDQLYTKKISAKVASFLVNDASDVFYGASYERSFAHYFLSKAYYSRYLKTQNKLDLQGARGTILAWDSYFSQLQRSAAVKTIYQNDLMLKIFGAEIHEVSEIRSDKQISLQLYKDALGILETMGGAFSVFNTNSKDFVKDLENSLSEGSKPSSKAYVSTLAQHDLTNFLHYKILALTREIRNTDFNVQLKALKPIPETLKKVNGQEGFIPQKIGKPFNIGLKGAVDSVENPAAKAFIETVGGAVLTAFAMNTLGMGPKNSTGPGSFVFAVDVMHAGVKEVAIAFELPMIDSSPKLNDYKLFILDETGKVLQEEPLAIISENGEIAKLVLEEDVVSRYVKTGTRVAVKHILAIVAAMQIHDRLKESGAFIAGAAAMATYVAASKGIEAMEKADTRHWTTLPQAFRMMELNLPSGNYQIALALKNNAQDPSKMKVLGNIKVIESAKAIHTFKLTSF